VIFTGALMFIHAQAQFVTLDTATTHSITPSGDRRCFADTVNNSLRLTAASETWCELNGGAFHVHLDMGSGIGFGPVDLQTNLRTLITRFEVPVNTQATNDAYVPVHIGTLVKWSGRLLNWTGVPAANVGVEMWLRLREGSASDPSYKGLLIAQTNINTVMHGGVNACISFPKGAAGTAALFAKCLLAAWARDSGSFRPEISALLKAGQVYNLEVEFIGYITNGIELPGPAYEPEQIDYDEAGSLACVGTIIRTGSDPAAQIGDLQMQIDELKAKLRQLR
jgi:hypothetical protein